MIPAPTPPCCGGTLAKLGETITETLESIPRRYNVIQTVAEKSPAVRARRSPGACTVHPIVAAAGRDLLATVLHAKFGEHQPLNRQSERFAAEGIELSVSTLADWVAPA